MNRLGEIDANLSRRRYPGVTSSYQLKPKKFTVVRENGGACGIRATAYCSSSLAHLARIAVQECADRSDAVFDMAKQEQMPAIFHNEQLAIGYEKV